MATFPVRTTRWLNCAIFGEFGVGKTHLAASSDDVESMKDVMFIDIESGDLTLETRPNLVVIPIRDYKKIQKIYTWLKYHYPLRDKYLALQARAQQGNEEAQKALHETTSTLQQLQDKLIDRNTDPEDGRIRLFRTVIIDSFTEIQKLNMYMLMGVDIGKTKLDEEMEKAQWDEWGQTTNMIRLLVRTFRDIPYHTILVCSEKMVEDKNKRASIVLNLPKTLAAEIPGFLDMVGYLAMKTDNSGAKQRILFLQPGSGFQAKSRFPNSPPYMIDPTMAQIMKMVRSGG